MDSSSPENCPSNIYNRLGFSPHPNPNFLFFQRHHLSLFPPPQGTNFPPQREAVCTAPTTAVTTGGAESDHELATYGPAQKQLEDILGGRVFYGSEMKRAAEGVSGFMHALEDTDPTKQHPPMVLSAAETPPPATKKSSDTFAHRTSIYRGVTRHRWTGRYEAHLWDNSCKREGQTRKGRQVYLGGYDKEEKAARAYDLAALKYWGPATTTNFPVTDYEKEIEEMKHTGRQEFVASLRRKSSGFSRGASIYRGVTRHHQHGRWQARIGRVAGNKDLYLGTFSTQEEAAEAYDIAAVKFRGTCAVTNFDISRYKGTCNIQSITTSSPKPTPPPPLSIDCENTGTVPFSVSGLPAGYGCPMEVIPVKNEHDQKSTNTTTCGNPVYSMDVPTGDQGSGCGSSEQLMNTASKGGGAFASPVFAPAAGGSRSCVGTEVHSFQVPKSNLSALHALILEMEYEAS